MVIFAKLIGELQNHRYIYASLVILHILLLMTNGFGTGFKNPTIEFEVNLEYGSPINQNTGQTVNITEFLTSTDIILVNQSPNSDIYYYFPTYLPVHDCEVIEFNATIEVLSDTARVTMQIVLFGRGDIVSTTFVEDIQAGSTTISLQITKQMTQVTDWDFVNVLEIHLFSPDTMIIRNVIGRAVSSIELCPVTIDILTTENNSITHYDYSRYMHAGPTLNLTQNNTNHTSRNIHSWVLSHGPIFLEPGNYSGDAYWFYGGMWRTSYPSTPINLEIEENQQAEWRIRLLTMRIDIHVEPNLSSYFLYIDLHNEELFDIRATNATLPRFIYAPAVYTDIQVNGWVSTDLPIIFFPRVPEAQIIVNGSNNLVYTLRYPYPIVLNTVLTPYQIALLLYLPSLSLILLTRVVLLVEPSGPKRTWLNPRLIPVIGMLSATVTPWFFSSHIQHFSSLDVYFYRAFFFPFFFQTTWTDGSMAVAFAVTELVPTDLVSLSYPVLFFWVPLAYAAARIRTDTSVVTNTEFGAVLLFILFFSGLGWFAVSSESELMYFPGPGLIIIFLSFAFWLVGLKWLDASRNNLKKEEELETSIKEKAESGN